VTIEANDRPARVGAAIRDATRPAVRKGNVLSWLGRIPWPWTCYREMSRVRKEMEQLQGWSELDRRMTRSYWVFMAWIFAAFVVSMIAMTAYGAPLEGVF
jgi:hypothetical protein